MPADANVMRIAHAICADRKLKLIAEVGAGAFKHTFEVHTLDKRPRALKIYKRTGADARTVREVEAIGRCAHPNIVSFELIDTIREGAEDYVFSLEEFLAGGTLTAHVASGLLPIAALQALGAPLIDAVGHIASHDLVHRDLKPDNIMFRGPGGPPVVVDFGLVRDLSASSLTATWVPNGPGTPFYAAPEQLNNEKSMIDWRADQFALGVVLTICSWGKHPYALPGLHPSLAVERVARRESLDSDFVTWADGQGLIALKRMVEPWPVDRFRTPQQLSAAWQSQGKAA